MKGFPNQVAELPKIRAGLQILIALVDAGSNARNDGVFGEALVRGGVAGTGHTPQPVEAYLQHQRTLPPGNQSFRTTARGLRELFSLLRLIVDTGTAISITPLGRRVTEFAGPTLSDTERDYWRAVIRDMTHFGKDDRESHPYQVLLRLVAARPGITRAKCALALEARDDSDAELDRITALVDLAEDAIRQTIDVTQSNWDNAKKVLPKFAEQLEDVIRTGDSFHLAAGPGRSSTPSPATPTAPSGPATQPRPRPPRVARQVTAASIATTPTDSSKAEAPVAGNLDPAALAAANALRQNRLQRHEAIVRDIARRLEPAGGELYEDPFDILKVLASVGILIEVKTLDGSDPDEREQVRSAFGQLFYYLAFITIPVSGTVHKIACFESAISSPHHMWLNDAGVGVIWYDSQGRLVLDSTAEAWIGTYLS